MASKTISVIIPCYNGETVIDRSIESVYMQKCHATIELIVVDDGSADGSKEHILAWIPYFEKIGASLKYVFQENAGPGGAINTGLKYVTGEYLTLLDADDAFLQGSFEKRFSFLEANSDYVGVQTNGWQDKHGKQKLFTFSPPQSADLFSGLVGGSAYNWAGSYMIRTDVLFAFYPTRDIYPSRFGQHMQLLLPVSYKNKFGFIDEPLMVYYLQDNSHSQSVTPQEQQEKNDRNFYGYQDIYRHMIDLVVKEENEHRYYLSIIQSWQYNHELKKAMRNGDRKEMEKYFRLYKSTGRMTLNEKINYFSVTNPAKAIILKLYRRIRALFKREERNS